MKKLALSITILATGLIAPSFAQTTFTNADGANDYIQTAGNWDSGLPDGQQGTIAIDAGYDSNSALVGYDIVQTDGQFSRTNGLNALALDNSSWEMNGATASFGTTVRGMTLSNGSTFTLTNGTYNQESNRDITLSSNSSITVNGGTFNADRSIRINGTTSFTMNAGTVTMASSSTFGQGGFISGAGTMNLNGGTLTGDRFVFQQAGTIANFGTAGSGSVTFNDWGTGNGAGNTGDRQDDRNIQLNFLAGSQMSLSMLSTTRELDLNDDTFGDAGTHWAQALWESDRLLYNGDNFTTLGVSWADATNSSIGFGSEYFDFSGLGSFGGSLNLAAVPEPSTVVLLLGGLAGLVLLRRKH